MVTVSIFVYGWVFAHTGQCSKTGVTSRKNQRPWETRERGMEAEIYQSDIINKRDSSPSN